MNKSRLLSLLSGLVCTGIAAGQPHADLVLLDRMASMVKEKDRGSLQVGKLADVVVLSRDILAEVEHENIARTRVLMTIVGGTVVHEKWE
jgi:hypothetical protein